VATQGIGYSPGKKQEHILVDITAFNIKYAIVRNTYSVGIPAQILDNSAGAIKRLFAVDHPFFPVKLS